MVSELRPSFLSQADLSLVLSPHLPDLLLQAVGSPARISQIVVGCENKEYLSLKTEGVKWSYIVLMRTQKRFRGNIGKQIELTSCDEWDRRN